MKAIKEFLKAEQWEDKKEAKRRTIRIYLFGGVIISLIGFVGGLYISGSVEVGLIMAAFVLFPFLVTAFPIMLISLFGIERGWSKATWKIVGILMILVGLLILLWRYIQF